MKRLIIFLLTAVIVFTFTGCAHSAADNSKAQSSVSSDAHFVRIVAEYTGGTVYVGSTLREKDFSVSAEYSDGSLRELGKCVFDGLEIKSTGENIITVTRGDYSAKVTVFAVEVAISAVSAVFVGRDASAGASLSESDFDVSLLWDDGHTEKAENFTYSPKSIKNEGSNYISISCAGQSCTVKIESPLLELDGIAECAPESVWTTARMNGITSPGTSGAKFDEIPEGTGLTRIGVGSGQYDRVRDGNGCVFYLPSCYLSPSEPLPFSDSISDVATPVASEAIPSVGNEYGMFYCTDESFALSDELRSELELLLSDKTDTSLFVYDIATGFSFSYNASAALYAASTIKLASALYVFSLLDKGEITPDTSLTYRNIHYSVNDSLISFSPDGTAYTVRELLSYMLEYDDSSAYYMFLDIYGIDAHNAFIESLGCASARITDADRFGRISASDEALIWSAAYGYIASGGENASLLLDMLVGSEHSIIGSALPEYGVAHKFGCVSGCYGDSGIVFAPAPYISVIQTSSEVSEESTSLIRGYAVLLDRVIGEYLAGRD